MAPQYLPAFLTNLAEACTGNREFDRARRLLHESTAIATSMGIDNLLAHNYGILASLEAEQQHAGATAAADQAYRHLPACNLEDQAIIAQQLQKAYARLAMWQPAHRWLARYTVCATRWRRARTRKRCGA